MERYYEWASKPNTRKGRMITELEKTRIISNMPDPGYCSVYDFSKEDAFSIKESGCSRGLNKFTVGSDTLFIDIDSDDPHYSKMIMKRTVDILKQRNLYYRLWFSGCKGYHIELMHDRIEDRQLPYWHLKTVESLGITEFDQSLYQAGRLISLPGRIHPKTGKKKAILDTVDGEKVALIMQNKPEELFNFEETGTDLAGALYGLQWLIKADPRNGNRHMSLFGAARDCFKAGMSKETVVELLCGVNDLWTHPKPHEEVIRAIEGAASW